MAATDTLVRDVSGDWKLNIQNPAPARLVHMQIELILTKDGEQPVVTWDQLGTFNLGKLTPGDYKYQYRQINIKVPEDPSRLFSQILTFTIPADPSATTADTSTLHTIPETITKAELKKLDYEIEIETRELELAEIRRKKMRLQTSSVEPSAESTSISVPEETGRETGTAGAEGDSSFLMQDSAIAGDSLVGSTKIERQIINDPEAITKAAIKAYRMGKSEDKD
jgi:hypothetical protein